MKPILLFLLTCAMWGQGKPCPSPIMINTGHANDVYFEDHNWPRECYSSVILTEHPGKATNIFVNGVRIPDVDCSGAKCITTPAPKPAVSSDKEKYPPMGTIPNAQICADCNTQSQSLVDSGIYQHNIEAPKPSFTVEKAVEPPTYKGLVCMGWTKPESQAIADGESEGENLVVNTPLTDDEKKELYYARKSAEAARHKQQAVEETILSNHRLLFPLSDGSDWLRQGPCGDTPMIRFGEYHITQFVPSNPEYPGSDSATMLFHHGDPAKCRAYFANMRKTAVGAKYGADSNDYYVPNQEKP